MAGNLGGRAKNKWLAAIVSFKSPEIARQAARKMDRLYRSAKGMPGRVLIVRSADLAYRRAIANASNRRADPMRRKQMRSIAAAYGAVANRYRSKVDLGAPRSDPRISKSYYRMKI